MSGESFEVDAESWCEMTDDLDRLRAERVVANNTIFALTSENVGLLAENSRLSAEVERMRGVLERMEWSSEMQDPNEEGDYYYGKMVPCCHECNSRPDQGHTPTCPLGRALGRPECGEQKQ